MRDYVIITDSCCDLPADLARELEIEVVPLSLQMGSKTYRNWLDGREISFPDFYRRIRAGETATTSAVSVGDFEEIMRPILTGGRDILCLCFSSALSTTYQSACIAAQTLSEEVPEGTVRVVDTLSASLGQGLLVYLCAQEKRRGASLEALTAYAEATRGKVCHWFTVDDLNHLKRGGRISATAALFGTMLSIKPVMYTSPEGKLIPMGKARGMKAALTELVNTMDKLAIRPIREPVFICHADCQDSVDYVKGLLYERFGVTDVRADYIGPVIGSHTGCGTLGLFFMGTER